MLLKKILFLYSELAGYTVNCLNTAVERNPDIEITVVRWAINKEAPFNFVFHERVKVYEKSKVDLAVLSKKINPNLIICSGWMDKEYMQFIKTATHTITTVLMFDNYWEGTLKQIIGQYIIPYQVTKYFNYCWLPGEIQKQYAKKIGFKESQIELGFYATDLTPFDAAYKSCLIKKKKKFPRKFLYVGRYLELKGIKDLWSAFITFSKENPNWELHCVGIGDLYGVRVQHPKIVHHGFVQPLQLIDIIAETGVFVLPSHYDHWGMAVQEFAASGFPLICSDTVGANCAFLKENGYIFKAKNVASLITAMNKIAELSTENLMSFGSESNKLSKLYDINTWSNTLMKLLSK